MEINAYPLNNRDYSALDAQRYTCTRTSGVYSAETHCKVTAGSGMTVVVAPGVGWLKPAEFQGFCFSVDSAQTLTVPAADAANARVDGVHIRYDSLAQSVSLLYVPGTPSALPTPPEPIRNGNLYELVLARVTVLKNATAITSSNITDTRLDETLCGLMRDGVTGIPTAQLLSNAQSAVDTFLTQSQAAITALQQAVAPAALLTALKTVDGASSGLDAQYLSGQSASYYLNYNNATNKPTIPAYSTAVPKALGTASAGSATGIPRPDHVHPLPTLSALGMRKLLFSADDAVSGPDSKSVTVPGLTNYVVYCATMYGLGTTVLCFRNGSHFRGSAILGNSASTSGGTGYYIDLSVSGDKLSPNGSGYSCAYYPLNNPGNQTIASVTAIYGIC
jgi:hypothetical protein